MFIINKAHFHLIENSKLEWKVLDLSNLNLGTDCIGLVSNFQNKYISAIEIQKDDMILALQGSEVILSNQDRTLNIELNKFENIYSSNSGSWIKLCEKLFGNMNRKLFLTPTQKIVEIPIFTQRGSVHILARTESGKFLIVKQFRLGPEKVLFDIPGGGMEENEASQAAGLRELLEETGYTGDIVKTHTCYSAAYNSMLKHTLIVDNCNKIQGYQNDDEEIVTVIEVSKNELLEIVENGVLTLSDFATIMYGLHFLS